MERGYIDLMEEMGRKHRVATVAAGRKVKSMSREEMSLAPRHMRRMAGPEKLGFSIKGGRVRHGGRTIDFGDSLKMPPIREPKWDKVKKNLSRGVKRSRIPVRKNLFKGGRIPGF